MMRRITACGLRPRLIRLTATTSTGAATGGAAAPPPPMWKRGSFQTIVGFTVGFGSVKALEYFGLLDGAAHRLWIQRHDDEKSYVPKGVRSWLDEKGLLHLAGAEPPTAMNAVVDSSDRQGASFLEVYNGCSMPEQLEWLAEHVSQYPPYFYIEELVHTWAAMHYGKMFYGIAPAAATNSPKASSTDGGRSADPLAPSAHTTPTNRSSGFHALVGVGELALSAVRHAAHIVQEVRDDSESIKQRAATESPTSDGVDELVRGLLHLTANGQISPQAGFSALAVLAEASKAYALSIAKHVAVDTGAIETPFQPVRHDKQVTLPEDGLSAEDAAQLPETPIFAPNRPTIDNEAQALLCFAALVDATRRIIQRNESKELVRGKPKLEAEVCGPPVDLLDYAGTARKNKSFGTTVLVPPIRDYLNWIDFFETSQGTSSATVIGSKVRALAHLPDTRQYVESGAFAAATDPVVALLATVDAALRDEIGRQQRDRYDFAWTHPINWLYPVLKLVHLKDKPVAVADAKTQQKRFKLPKTTDSTLPFVVDRDATLLHALRIVGDDESVEWLQQYSRNAAAWAQHISKAKDATTDAPHSNAHADGGINDLMRGAAMRIVAAGRLARLSSTVDEWASA